MAQTAENPFYDSYEAYRQPGLEERRFRQQDILHLIEALKAYPVFTLSKAGESVEGREIPLIKVGRGETSILLWSQMHGNEPTATMALMDLFNFFKKEGDGLQGVRRQLLDELSIYIIPMLNPDGAEVYQRRNALGVDLNRDARRLISPEAQLLKRIRDSLQADWGFNLHDQDIYYATGKSGKPATISFLAPPYDEEKSTNAVRSRAMKLIAGLNNTLQGYIPGQVGKWSDAFEPRAFGDNIQKWGTSTILIESGGYPGDPEKQYIRKLNFVALMEGLQAIATKSYKANELSDYFAIPENERRMFDLFIQNVQLEVNGKVFVVDIGINRKEVAIKENRGFYLKSTIEEVDDLSGFGGYQELNAEGLQAIPGKVYPEIFKNRGELERADMHELIAAGYTSVWVEELPSDPYTPLPLNLLSPEVEGPGKIALEEKADFVLKKDGELRYAIINGFIYDIQAKRGEVKNALVERK